MGFSYSFKSPLSLATTNYAGPNQSRSLVSTAEPTKRASSPPPPPPTARVSRARDNSDAPATARRRHGNGLLLPLRRVPLIPRPITPPPPLPRPRGLGFRRRRRQAEAQQVQVQEQGQGQVAGAAARRGGTPRAGGERVGVRAAAYGGRVQPWRRREGADGGGGAAAADHGERLPLRVAGPRSHHPRPGHRARRLRFSTIRMGQIFSQVPLSNVHTDSTFIPWGYDWIWCLQVL